MKFDLFPRAEKKMLPLYRDPGFTFCFTEDRLISRFHLEGVEAGQQVSVYKIRPETGEQLSLLVIALTGQTGWVDLLEPLIIRAGEGFIAVPQSLNPIQG